MLKFFVIRKKAYIYRGKYIRRYKHNNPKPFNTFAKRRFHKAFLHDKGELRNKIEETIMHLEYYLTLSYRISTAFMRTRSILHIVACLMFCKKNQKRSHVGAAAPWPDQTFLGRHFDNWPQSQTHGRQDFCALGHPEQLLERAQLAKIDKNTNQACNASALCEKRTVK